VSPPGGRWWSSGRGVVFMRTIFILNKYGSKINKFGECLLPLGPESFSSRLLYRNVKVKIYKTMIMQAVLYGRETWYLTLRD
jgi:hypothetical protein